MHFNDGTIPAEYARHIGVKRLLIGAGLIVLTLALVWSMTVGAVDASLAAVMKTLAGMAGSKRLDMVVWNIRLPQALTDMTAGAGLAVAGAVMQSVLRNPLGSPLTLGISHAAAFGAAFSVMLLGGGIMTSSGALSISSPSLTAGAACCSSLITALAILAIARSRGSSPESMVLAGVALNALFTAGTMLLQYYADDVQLAAMVFWTFGDTARVSWPELGIIAAATLCCGLYFQANAWNYNAIDAGGETARGLGVRVERVRMTGMLLASFLTAVTMSFLGIIGFVGLVAPHMVRRLIGADHRYLLPAACVFGALLLLVSDTAARIIVAPHVLPVSVLTAFMGAPVFLFLIARRRS